LRRGRIPERDRAAAYPLWFKVESSLLTIGWIRRPAETQIVTTLSETRVRARFDCQEHVIRKWKLTENRFRLRKFRKRDGRLTFAWKDPNSAGSKLMTLEAKEFIRRVLLHVLPDGLTRSATSASGVTV